MHIQNTEPYVRYIHPYVPNTEKNAPVTVVAYDHRIFFTEVGTLGVQLPEAEFFLSAGDVIFLPSGTPYRMFAAEEQTKIIGINFDFYAPNDAHEKLFAPVAKSSYRAEDRVESPHFSEPEAFNAPFVLRNQAFAANILREMLREYREARIYSREMNGARMKLLLIGFARALAVGTPHSSLTVDALIDYIQKNYDRPLNNAEIGKALNFHPNYLNRLMLKSTGETMHRFLISYRLNRAADLLQTTAMSIFEIAEATGFGDVQQFTKAFRAAMGSTPSAFRKNI